VTGRPFFFFPGPENITINLMVMNRFEADGQELLDVAAELTPEQLTSVDRYRTLIHSATG